MKGPIFCRGKAGLVANVRRQCLLPFASLGVTRGFSRFFHEGENR